MVAAHPSVTTVIGPDFDRAPTGVGVQPNSGHDASQHRSRDYAEFWPPPFCRISATIRLKSDFDQITAGFQPLAGDVEWVARCARQVTGAQEMGAHDINIDI